MTQGSNALTFAVLAILLGTVPRVVAQPSPADIDLDQSPSTSVAALVVDSVTVIDVERGQRVPLQRVVIRGNRITTMGKVGTVPIPKGARLVKAAGKYLIPGLWDLHVHPQEYVDIAYPLFIAYGVTGVRDAGSKVPRVTLGHWKREIATGIRVGPRRDAPQSTAT